MACDPETFIGREPIEDDRGEPTGVWKIEAVCNGASRVGCGWVERLTEHDRHPNEWWITSDEMADLHARHLAHS